jgi:hypothetical protein
MDMAQIHAGAEPQAQAETSVAVGTNGAPGARHAEKVPKAYELTDGRGNRAYVWWDGNTPTVDADDPGFRLRVQRALTKPIWSREDELDEFGMRSDRFVLIQPDDPRYPNRLLWQWDQLGIRGLVSVDVVTLPDRQSVRRFSPLHRAVRQRLGTPGMPISSSTDRA